MLKRPITYTDFNDEKVTENFYFNLSEPELIELDVEYDGGMKKMLEKIIATEDQKLLLARFKEIILLAYGEKSADGKRFIKNDELREQFSQTAAYSTLFMELVSDENSAAEFVNGIMPKRLDQDKPDLTRLPAPPTTPPVPPTS